MSLTSINVNNTLVTSVDSEPTAGSDNLVKSRGVFSSIADNKTDIAFLKNRTFLQKSIMCYGEVNPCFIIDFIDRNSVKIGRGLKMYSIDMQYAQTVTLSEHPWYDKEILFPDTTSYFYHMLVDGFDIVIVTTKADLEEKVDNGYYYVCTIRRSVSRQNSSAYVNGNMNYYSFNGIKVYKDFSEIAFNSAFSEAFNSAFNKDFNNVFSETFAKAFNPYFPSKIIEKIEKNQDDSVATYINGVFDIQSIASYAGLNFWVSENDTEVYYIINIKSEKYSTWSQSSENKITHGARKYNKDAGTPSGLTVSNVAQNVEEDGSLILGVKIGNPDAVNDAVYRLIFWGEADTIHIASLRTYDEWAYSKCLSGQFGITAGTAETAKIAETAETAETAKIAETAETAFNGLKFEEGKVLGTKMNVSTFSGLSISEKGEYEGSVEVESVGNYLILNGTFPSSAYFMAIAILNRTEVPTNIYLRCTYSQNNNFSTILYSNSKVVRDKVVMITGVTPIEYEGKTLDPNCVYFRANTVGVSIDCVSIMGFSTPDNNFEEIFDFICNNIGSVLLNVNKLKYFGVLTADIALQADVALQANKSYTAFNGDKYEETEYPAVINGVTSQGSYSLYNGEYSLDALIENVNGYGNTHMGVSLPEEYPYYIGVAVVGNGYDPSDQPNFRLTGGDLRNVIMRLDKTVDVGDKYVRVIIVSAKEFSGSIIYPKKLYFFGNTAKVFNFHIYDFKAWAINNITEDNFSDIVEAIITSVKKNMPLTHSTFSLGVLTADKIKNTDNIVEDIIKELNVPPVPGIVCWGSSTTAGGGWVAKLSEMTGIPTFNGGVGGENLWTILGRIGSEPIRLNQSITIPADTTPIQLGTGEGSSTSIMYVRGHKITPLLQGNGLLNPVIIDGIEGTIKWTGTSYSDPTGIYTFTRVEAGEERATLPDEIVFSYGSRTMRNCIQILLLGYNGIYSIEEYVEMIKRAKEFAYNGKCLIIGRHAATNKDAADVIISEEIKFKSEFGMMFLSSREYMIAHGLDEAGIEPTEQDTQDIANGIIPSSLRVDTAHFNAAGYTVFVNLIYRRLKELGYIN